MDYIDTKCLWLKLVAMNHILEAYAKDKRIIFYLKESRLKKLKSNLEQQPRLLKLKDQRL